MAETEARFLQHPDIRRKQFVDGLENGMLDDDIGIKERAERMKLHRRFNTIHQNLRRLGRAMIADELEGPPAPTTSRLGNQRAPVGRRTQMQRSQAEPFRRRISVLE